MESASICYTWFHQTAISNWFHFYQDGMLLGTFKFYSRVTFHLVRKYTVRRVHTGRLLTNIDKRIVNMGSSLTGEDLRRLFIEFFQNKYQHTFVKSSSVVPHDDPTLLFTNAGMNQVCNMLDYKFVSRQWC